MRITGTYGEYAQLDPSRSAIVTENDVVTYGEWYHAVQRAAAAFTGEAGITKRVALFLPNGSLFLQLFAGACEAGWASIVGDRRWKEKEIKDRLQQTKPDLVFADAGMKGIFQNCSAKVIFLDEIEEWISESYEEDLSLADDNVPFYIGFTSGSTGNPKAFVRSHDSWIESFRCNLIDLGIEAGDHALISGSFVNSTFLYGALSTLYFGGTVYLLKKFAPSRLMYFLRAYPISTVYVVPTMLQALIKERCTDQRSLTIISTGAKWLPQTKEQMRLQFPNADFYEFYGSSELSYITVLKKEEQISHPDSVGRAVHNAALSIRDEAGNEVASGEEGILYVKSKMVFDGYIDNIEETNKVLQGDWATVYDIAKLDKEGYVYILGRKNDMILYGGINIYPQEIEQVLKRFEGVEDAAVVGVPDVYWGEKAAACIKGNVSLSSLKSYCAQQLTPYKVPRIWRTVDDLPYTTGGKVSRREVRKWLEEMNSRV